jgi:hypothetical protein
VAYLGHEGFRSIDNRFKQLAGHHALRISGLGQILDNLLQRTFVGRFNHCPLIGVRLPTELRPEPDRREQDCALYNEIVGELPSCGLDVCSDLLLSLLKEFTEGAHASAVSHRIVQSPGLRHQIVMLSPAWLTTSIIAASARDPALSARLNALLREVKCLAQAV